MTNREIAAQRFTAYQAEMLAFTMQEWPYLDVETAAARDAEINAKHGYKHGWIVVNGESFNMELAFPNERFPRFPADQGMSD